MRTGTNVGVNNRVTLPPDVIKFLKVQQGDFIEFSDLPDGRVVIENRGH